MIREQLEAALVEQGIARAIAKVIAVMSFSPQIEKHQNGWLIPLTELSRSTPSKRTQQRLMDASIRIQQGTTLRWFPVVVSIQQARDSQFLLYSFSPEFQAWAGLQQMTPSALH